MGGVACSSGHGMEYMPACSIDEHGKVALQIAYNLILCLLRDLDFRVENPARNRDMCVLASNARAASNLPPIG